MNESEKELRRLKQALSSRRSMVQNHYLALARMLMEKEQMPAEDIVKLAQRIKPLMRPKEGSSLKKGLYWSKPVPLTQSFYFNFVDSSVLRDKNGEILAVEALEKVSEFVCYHHYGGYYGCLRPSMDEIIQQFPTYLLKDEKAEYAVELVFPSLELHEVLDFYLDRHVSTVVVYRLKNGLPQELKEQEIIYK